MKKFWKKKDTDEKSVISKEEKKPIEIKLTDSDKEKLKEMIEKAEKEKFKRLGNSIGSR